MFSTLLDYRRTLVYSSLVKNVQHGPVAEDKFLLYVYKVYKYPELGTHNDSEYTLGTGDLVDLHTQRCV